MLRKLAVVRFTLQVALQNQYSFRGGYNGPIISDSLLPACIGTRFKCIHHLISQDTLSLQFTFRHEQAEKIDRCLILDRRG